MVQLKEIQNKGISICSKMIVLIFKWLIIIPFLKHVENDMYFYYLKVWDHYNSFFYLFW